MIKTVEEAIKFLEEKVGTHTQDLRKVSWRVYDEDFSCNFNTDKELIDYANEQKANYEEW